MDFDRIEPDDPDVDIDDEQQPLISESSEEYIPFVRRKTTTSQEDSERGQTAETSFITGEPSSNVRSCKNCFQIMERKAFWTLR